MAKVNLPTINIGNLLQPTQGKESDRRVWSIPLQQVWIPFFTATNTTGESHIAAEVLGAPLRLAKEKDGTPKFSQSGRPVVRVVKELSDQIRIVRENFMVGLQHYTGVVFKAMPNEYKAQVEAYHQVGDAISNKDMADLDAYLEKVKAEAAAESNGHATAPEAERELVAA